MTRLKSLIGIGVIVLLILFFTKGSFVKEKVNKKVEVNEKVKKAVEEFDAEYEDVSKDKDWNLLREIMNQ